MRKKDKQGRFVRSDWEPWQLETLKKLYPDTLSIEIAKKIGRGLSSVRNKAHLLGLRKSKEFMTMMGRMSSNHPKSVASRFQKGQVPPNKGRSQKDWMPTEAIERSKATRFKRGQLPHNHKPVGHERITKDGYIEVKIAEPNVFELKHRIVWMRENGAIPKGCNIQFKDGNPLNCHIDNLYMISRADQLKNENSYFVRYPKEVQLAIQAKGALNRQINKFLKEQENE